MSFEAFTRLVKALDPVSAGAVNKPLRSIDQNVRYIWDVLQAAGIGSTVYAHRQTVETESHQGMAVYLNSSTQRFERGLAIVEVDQATGVVQTSASSQVWGIIARKINATLADILLYGVDDIDISAAIPGGTVTAGVYYLSPSSPGYLVQQKPPVSVAVLRATPDGKVFVMPQFVDFLDRHTHHKFDLVCRPAGDTVPPSIGARHEITDADASLEGWLPANHEVFEDRAPPGAVFGYNLSQHAAVNNVWPPVPISNAYLEWDRGLESTEGLSGVHLGSSGLCILDRFGIWWMSNCYGDVPWPTDLDTAVSLSTSDSSDPECPRMLTMRLLLWLTRVNFATDATAVLSLHSGDDRIRVRCYGDSELEASTGHLELFLNLNLTVADDQLGYLAIKEFDGTTGEFRRGPVCEGIYALSENVQLVGAATRYLDPEDEDSPVVYQGPVGIVVAPTETTELDVQLVRLDGAEEEHYQDIMYLSFVPDEFRALRGKINVPAGLAVPSPQMSLRFLILGRAAGTLPQLVFSARRLPAATAGLDTPVDLPLTDFNVTCVTTAVLDDANQYVEATSEPFEVAAGETVFFSVSRNESDGYAAELGILRQAGIVTSSS